MWSMEHILFGHIDPPGTDGRKGGHYIHTWRPYVRKTKHEQRWIKTRDNGKWGLVGHFQVFRLVYLVVDKPSLTLELHKNWDFYVRLFHVENKVNQVELFLICLGKKN